LFQLVPGDPRQDVPAEIHAREHGHASPQQPVLVTNGQLYAIASLAAWIQLALAADLWNWWRHDAGALLGFRSGRAVALIPGKGCRYRLWDPVAGQTIRLDSESAASLEPCAFSFYRVLPEGPATPLRLLWFGVCECRKDLLRIVLTGLAIGLLGLATPLIMARLIGSVISEADRAEAGLLAGLLAVCSLASALFSYSRAIALQRLGGRAGSIILYALWDRLLTLPSSFLGKFAAGELASRASSIDHVRQTITGPLIANALGCPFALVQALLLFHYGPDSGKDQAGNPFGSHWDWESGVSLLPWAALAVRSLVPDRARRVRGCRGSIRLR
jgi:ABC-type bacteriocin/lantibiotic exporter with double-glycine peptidase domain